MHFQVKNTLKSNRNYTLETKQKTYFNKVFNLYGTLH
jgi:hypothetical protein